MNYKKQIASAVTGSALLLNMMAPVVAFAGISCTISSNGSDTANTCDFAVANSVVVNQDNDMDVDNDVDVDANTGDNNADGNTGGSVDIDTGDVDAEVSVTTTGNTNAAEVNGSGALDFDAEIEKNGTESVNNVDVDLTNRVVLNQNNDADVDNDVDVDADTGDNDADDNTGDGVSISTGGVHVQTVEIVTAINGNAAVVGGNDDAGMLSARIMENGSDTENTVDLALLNRISFDQDNDADVDNDVDVDADTGDNGAEDNTGDPEITTGDVEVDITLDTMANFNTAESGDGFIGDLEVVIDKNGTDSDNNFELDLTDNVNVGQDNDLDVDNDQDVDSETGDNDADDNTNGDVDISTGDHSTKVEVSTSGNANAFNGDMNLDLDVDFSELLDLLGALANLLGL